MGRQTLVNVRIGTLDSFRAIAILSVVLFHWFSFNDFQYLQGHGVTIFKQGRYGVNFFFIISGFIIFHSLENTPSYGRFLIHRAIRLYPSAIIASIFTFIVFWLVADEPINNLLYRFFNSITLITPKFLNNDYLDFSLWSLYPEIQFYLLAGLVYFLNPKKFPRNFTLIAVTMLALFWLTNNIKTDNYFHIDEYGIISKSIATFLYIFNLPAYIVYFAMGTQLYMLFKFRQEKKPPDWFTIIATALFAVLQIYFAIRLPTRIAYACMFALFVLFIYFPRSLRFINNRAFTTIGVSSYFLYLSHQGIGLVLLEKYGNLILPNTFVFPLVMTVVFILISIAFTLSIEKPLLRYMRKFF
jgi:peptidoglycan/LPS O-acetylase OafA/YrhL